MKSFHSFITERRAKNFGTKGGEGGTQSTSNTPFNRRESRANMQDPNRSQRGGRSNPVRGRKTPVNIPSKSGDLITNFKADANVPPEEQFQRLLDKAAKDASGERVGQQATHPVDAETTRQSGREKTGGRVKGDRPVGAQKPRSRFVKGQGYTIPTKGRPATRIPGGTGTSSGSLSKGTLKFSGDAKYRRLLRRLTTDVKPLPSGTGVRKDFKPEPTSKPTAAPKPRSVQLPNVTKPAPTRVAPPPLTQNKFLRPTPTPQPKPTAAPAPVTQAPAPKPQFKGSKQFAPGSSGKVSTGKNVLDAIDNKPSRPKVAPRTSQEVLRLQRSVNRGIRQRAASGLLKGAGVAAAGLEARGEYLSRLDKGQSQSTALKGSASRVGGGWLGAQTGAGLGAKIGSVLGPKGAAAGGLIGGVAGYMGGAELATKAYDAARNFKFSDFQKKVDQFRKLDASKYRTFGSNK
jgi:hypothetical protein